MKIGKKLLVLAVLCLALIAGLFVESKAKAATLKKEGEYHLKYTDEKKLNMSLTSSVLTFKNAEAWNSKWEGLSYKTCKFKVNKNTKFVCNDWYGTKDLSRTKFRKMFKDKFSSFFDDVVEPEYGWAGSCCMVEIDVTVKNGVAEEVVIRVGFDT